MKLLLYSGSQCLWDCVSSFTSEMSISTSPLGLLKLGFCLHSWMLGAIVPGRTPGQEAERVWACDSHARGRTPVIQSFSSLCVAHPDWLCPELASSAVSLLPLYVFNGERSSLLGLGLDHQWLFCRWLWFWCAGRAGELRVFPSPLSWPVCILFQNCDAVFHCIYLYNPAVADGYLGSFQLSAI